MSVRSMLNTVAPNLVMGLRTPDKKAAQYVSNIIARETGEHLASGSIEQAWKHHPDMFIPALKSATESNAARLKIKAHYAGIGTLLAGFGAAATGHVPAPVQPLLLLGGFGELASLAAIDNLKTTARAKGEWLRDLVLKIW